MLTDNSVLLGNHPGLHPTSLKKVEEAGFSEVILYFNVGMKPHNQVKEEMDRFMREVAPEFRRQAQAAPRGVSLSTRSFRGARRERANPESRRAGAFLPGTWIPDRRFAGVRNDSPAKLTPLPPAPRSNPARRSGHADRQRGDSHSAARSRLRARLPSTSSPADHHCRPHRRARTARRAQPELLRQPGRPSS